MANDEPYYTAQLTERAAVYRSYRDEVSWVDPDDPPETDAERAEHGVAIADEPLLSDEYPSGAPAEPVIFSPARDLDFPDSSAGRNCDEIVSAKVKKQSKLNAWFDMEADE
jgi:hypothetical protein